MTDFVKKTNLLIERTMDLLEIQGLHVKTRIGICPWEQNVLQSLLVDISIPSDFTACNDNLANTIDYAQLCEQVTTYLELNRFQLIETVGQQLIELIQREFKVSKLTLRISKPHAIKNASNVSVTFTR